MTALLFLLLLDPDPCAGDTREWKSITHGPEEIRYLTEGRFTWLALWNRGGRTTHVDVVFRELGLAGSRRVFDIAAGRDLGRTQGGFARKLAPGACAAIRLGS